MKEFLKSLVDLNSTTDEKAVAGYVGLLLAIIYILTGLFKVVNVDILNSLFFFIGSCFGISALQNIGEKKNE